MLLTWVFGFIVGCLLFQITTISETATLYLSMGSALLFIFARLLKPRPMFEAMPAIITFASVVSGLLWAGGHPPPTSIDLSSNYVKLFSTGGYQKPLGSEADGKSSAKRIAVELRSFILKKSFDLPSDVRPWIRSILLGHRTYLSASVKNAFKSTGTYHLLVVSGLHVSLMAATLIFSLKFPLQILYTFRLIRPMLWSQLAPMLSVLAATFALLYAHAVGLSQASQRAALIFATLQFSLVFFGSVPLRKKLAFAAFLQCLFFPTGFLCEATLMSWGAYLFVIQLAKRGSRKVIYQLIFTQTKLTILVAAFFGQLNTLGIVANLVLIPVFPFVFFCAILLVFCSSPFLISVQRGFIDFVETFAILPERYALLSIDITTFNPCVRIAFLMISAALLLNCIKSLTSKSERSN